MNIRKIDNDTLAFEYDTGTVRTVSRDSITSRLAEIQQGRDDAQAALFAPDPEATELAGYLALLEQA